MAKKQKFQNSPFLFDATTGRIVGLKNDDQSESVFGFQDDATLAALLPVFTDASKNLTTKTAANAFAAIKQAASETATGVAELATNAEALTGTDTSRIVTPDDLKYVLDRRNLSLQNLLSNTDWIVASGSTVENVGSNLVTNGDFAEDDHWTKGTNITITGSKAVFSATPNLELLYQPIAPTNNKLYAISLTISDYSAGGVVVFAYADGGTASYSPIYSSDGTYTFVFKAIGTSWYNLQIRTAGETTLKIDDVTLYEVTAGYVGADNLCFDGWSKNSTVSVYREYGSANINGIYGAKVVGSATEQFIYTPGISDYTTEVNYKKYRGRPVAVGCWVLTSAASKARIGIEQTSGETYSSYHTGSGALEWLEVPISVASNTIKFRVLLGAGTSNTAYFSQPMLVFSSSIGQGNYSPAPNEEMMCQTPFVLDGYNAAVPADATINLEAASSGKIGKGVKRLLGYHYGQNTAANKYLLLGTSSGVTQSRLISQVANVPISLPFDVKCDNNGDMYIDVEDANWSAYNIYVTGVQT